MDRYTHFSEKRLQEIERKIEALQKLKRRKITDPEFIFLDEAEFKQLLGVSENTPRSWRKQGRIPFSVVGRKIYYRLSDISEMIKVHTGKSNNKKHEQKENPTEPDKDSE